MNKIWFVNKNWRAHIGIALFFRKFTNIVVKSFFYQKQNIHPAWAHIYRSLFDWVGKICFGIYLCAFYQLIFNGISNVVLDKPLDTPLEMPFGISLLVCFGFSLYTCFPYIFEMSNFIEIPVNGRLYFICIIHFFCHSQIITYWIFGWIGFLVNRFDFNFDICTWIRFACCCCCYWIPIRIFVKFRL